jgi:CheY-like chemotaxis protein/nitrogen-specific signal transduction histidine kinase
MKHSQDSLKKANETLRNALAETTLAEQERMEYVTQVTRNVRIPLSTITGMSAIARENLENPDKLLGCLEKIELASQQLLSIINEVTDMTELNERAMLLNEAPFSLGRLLWRTVSLFVEKAHEKNITLRLVTRNVRSEALTGDYERIGQLLGNLIANAVNFTLSGGHVTVTLTEIPTEAEGYASFEIMIADDGIGMSAEFLGRMYNPFHRADDSRIAREQGVGLGLPIAMRLARMMSGDIRAVSEPESGSTFTVSLQFRCNEVVPEKTPFPEARFLIVAPSLEEGGEVAALLTEQGIESDTITYEDDYRDKVGGGYLAFIIVWGPPDHIPPDYRGYRLATAIKEEYGEEVPPLLLLTNWWESSKEMVFAKNIANIATKPLSWAKLAPVLSRVCPESLMSPKDKVPDVILVGKRILVAEDNELNAEVIKETLEGQGIVVEVAENGIKVLDALLSHGEHYFDCILMDVKMPVMNGYTTTQRIRGSKRKDIAQIPVVAMTADAYSIDIRCAKNAGMNAHVAKPFNIEELLTILRELL